MNSPSNTKIVEPSQSDTIRYYNFIENLEKALKIKISRYVKMRNFVFFQTMLPYNWDISWIDKYLENSLYKTEAKFDQKYLEKNILKYKNEIQTWKILIWFYVDHETKETKRVIFASEYNLMKIVAQKKDEVLWKLFWWQKVN